MLAFQREVGIPQEDGFKFEFSLLVYEAASGLVRQIVENKRVIGFSWEPGTYRIAYGVETTGDYFATRGSPSSEYAKGILSIDALSGNSEELVPPLQGYWIVNPHWSPTGRYLSFEEVLYMEGRGQFAYYDFSNREYVSWGRPVGYYDWSPDEHLIAYDTLTYNPDGTERIWISSIGGSDERPFSRENDQGYAFYPAFSPQGDYLAYFTGINGLESSQYTLIVQPVEAGEPRELGIFTQVTGFRWSPDGMYLALSAGPYEARQVFLVSMSDGNVEAIAPGYEPTWQP